MLRVSSWLNWDKESKINKNEIKIQRCINNELIDKFDKFINVYTDLYTSTFQIISRKSPKVIPKKPLMAAELLKSYYYKDKLYVKYEKANSRE